LVSDAGNNNCTHNFGGKVMESFYLEVQNSNRSMTFRRSLRIRT